MESEYLACILSTKDNSQQQKKCSKSEEVILIQLVIITTKMNITNALSFVVVRLLKL